MLSAIAMATGVVAALGAMVLASASPPPRARTVRTAEPMETSAAGGQGDRERHGHLAQVVGLPVQRHREGDGGGTEHEVHQRPPFMYVS